MRNREGESSFGAASTGMSRKQLHFHWLELLARGIFRLVDDGGAGLARERKMMEVGWSFSRRGIFRFADNGCAGPARERKMMEVERCFSRRGILRLADDGDVGLARERKMMEAREVDLERRELDDGGAGLDEEDDGWGCWWFGWRRKWRPAAMGGVQERSAEGRVLLGLGWMKELDKNKTGVV
ncbi:unnamed protein product [Linum trigynum]|uniref:Uncharacterized protein n=1 Tax=Linum trigynum TaxID=586398 RepID=A0AAV2F503_9ROSI